MKINIFALILSIIFTYFQISYSWGLEYWVKYNYEKATDKKNVTLFDTLDKCEKDCDNGFCSSINDYRGDAKTALINLGFDLPKDKLTSHAICYNVDEIDEGGINHNRWSLPNSSYFVSTQAIHHAFKYPDICHSFCQPLYKSGCYITSAGWKCFKETAPILEIPKNATPSNFTLPEKFRIYTMKKREDSKERCLYFKPQNSTVKIQDTKLNYTICDNTTIFDDNYFFYSKQLDQNNYLILHGNPQADILDSYAITFTRNLETIKFEKVLKDYYKQVWELVPTCTADSCGDAEGQRYKFRPYKIDQLCARINYLRKCDDDTKKVNNLQIFNITKYDITAIGPNNTTNITNTTNTTNTTKP